MLARQVLLGKTKGYKKHPQLVRFRQHPDPIKAINHYLGQIYQESVRRGYRFDISKLPMLVGRVKKISVTTGQLLFELERLRLKFKKRSPSCLSKLSEMKPIPHCLFTVVEGRVEDWERI